MSRNCLRKKQVVLLSIAFIVMALAFITLTQSAYADSSQSYASVSLQYFTVQVQYPPLVVPGESVIIHIQATAKSAVNLNSLTAYAYYADGLNLHQVASATVVGSQNVAAGNTFTNDLQLTVPQGVPRTSLFATFTESVKGSYVSSYSYSSNYYGNYYCGYYGYDMNNCYYYPYYGSSYPQYSYYTTSDSGVSTLSYVNATTPEYTSLQSQYQSQQQQLSQAQSQNQNLQQQVAQQNQEISQLQSQVQQLNQALQAQQNAFSQKESDNSNLSSQLTTATSMNRDVTYLAVGFGLIAILALVLGHRSNRPRKTQSVNPYASNYVPPQTEQPQSA